MKRRTKNILAGSIPAVGLIAVCVMGKKHNDDKHHYLHDITAHITVHEYGDQLEIQASGSAGQTGTAIAIDRWTMQFAMKEDKNADLPHLVDQLSKKRFKTVALNKNNESVYIHDFRFNRAQGWQLKERYKIVSNVGFNIRNQIIFYSDGNANTNGGKGDLEIEIIGSKPNCDLLFFTFDTNGKLKSFLPYDMDQIKMATQPDGTKNGTYLKCKPNVKSISNYVPVIPG